MSAVSITQVKVLDNPAPFLSPLRLEISYECIRPLSDDLEWSLIYVGSANDPACDQVLESVMVGPVAAGNFRFIFEADPPAVVKMPESEILGVTVLLLSCAYRDQKFVQVGYYVNNEYAEEGMQQEPPARVALDKVVRNIWEEKPRVTKYGIDWGAVSDPMAEDALEEGAYMAGAESADQLGFGYESELAPWVQDQGGADAEAAVLDGEFGFGMRGGLDAGLEARLGTGLAAAPAEAAAAAEPSPAEAAAAPLSAAAAAAESMGGDGVSLVVAEAAVCASVLQEREAEALLQGGLREQESC